MPTKNKTSWGALQRESSDAAHKRQIDALTQQLTQTQANQLKANDNAIKAQEHAEEARAKRKAARSMGAGEGDALPTNDEIETELRAWQSLYQEDEQRERVHDLRTTALEVMQLLAEFNPCLTGAALDGTAGRYGLKHVDNANVDG